MRIPDRFDVCSNRPTIIAFLTLIRQRDQWTPMLHKKMKKQLVLQS
jgi:hypothetical protein